MFAWASAGGVGPWAATPGRRDGWEEAGPFAGRRLQGQLGCVGASGLALCSLRVWSQTTPLFSCWDFWEVGRLDWGSVGGGRDMVCLGFTGPMPTPLKIRPRIKTELKAEPEGVGLAGYNIPEEAPWAAGAGWIHTCAHTLP